MQMGTLQKLKEWATILSLVAVPVLVALGTQTIQNRISEESMRKDYVSIAVGILTKGKDEQPDIELRQWAVDVIDRNSPVSLPPSLRQKLRSGETTIGLSLGEVRGWADMAASYIGKDGKVHTYPGAVVTVFPMAEGSKEQPKTAEEVKTP